MAEIKNVLIVEDEPMLLAMVAEVFKENQIAVDTASNGLEAIEMLKLKNYIAVLTDIQMPKLGGVELCKKAKQLKDIHQPLYWIALTAHLPEDLDATGSLSIFDDSFYKPISPNLLAKMIKLKIQS